MPSRNELKQAVIDEHAAGFTYDDELLARVLRAIDTNDDPDLVDEVLDFHYGYGTLTD